MAKELQLVVVTPETTLLNEPVTSVGFPLYDGSMGVLPGRAPLVGRLGSGELWLVHNGDERSYYVDGGFVQVRNDVVTLLTSRCIAVDQIDTQTAASDLQQALSRPAAGDEAIDARLRDQERARRMLEVAHH